MYQEAISYDAIRETKLKEYGTELNKWIWVLIKQYKDRTHFIFELLQNAEDTGANKIKLILERERLIIEHNGHPFTKKDVISITKIADSSKNEGQNSIGRFGIGFKSVYTYTTKPRIYSGKYCFEIRNFVYPFEINPISLPEEITRIEIPFDNEEISPNKAFQEINQALNEQIGTDSILFLNNIQEITISVTGAHRDIHITKNVDERAEGDGCIFEVALTYQNAHIQKSENYLLFSDNEKEPVKIAFQVVNDEIIPIKSTRIYTFFPTDKESHQAFLIHAPFETTPARDNIVEDSIRNHEFINSICSGLEMAFCWMRDYGYLTLSTLNDVFPTYAYPKDPLFRPIYESAVALISSGESLIPTNCVGSYKSIQKVVFPENMTIVECFDDDDIHLLFNKPDIYWIAKDICRDAYQNFKNFLSENADIKTYSWKEVLSSLTARFLEQKQLSWFHKLFDSIQSFAILKTRMGAKHDVAVSSIPFVRLANGRHITPFENGSPTVYLNNPNICPNRIEAAFLQDETIYDFYTNNLRIPEYNIERIVADTILPKYKSRNEINISLVENISDLKNIMNALQEKGYLFDGISQYYVLTDGDSWYKPYELHIPDGFRGIHIPDYKLIGDQIELKYISFNYENYFDYQFFQELGCVKGLMQEKIDIKTYYSYAKKYLDKSALDELSKKITTKNYQKGIKWNVIYEGFPEILQNPDRTKSLDIARFLNSNIANFEIRGELIGANDLSFSGAHVDTLFGYSTLGLQICFTEWMYTKKGERVAPITIYKHELDEEYERISKRLLEKLPFKEEDRATAEILSRYNNAQEREILKRILTDSDMLAQVTKAIADKERKERERKNRQTDTPVDILVKTNDHHTVGKPPIDSGTYDEPGAIKDPERYKQNVQKEFEESLDNFTYVSDSSLQFSYNTNVSDDEKRFLLREYNGVCQICQTIILRKDGKPHFNAINVLNTSTLAEEYKDRLDLGWNSLCLCPNCAAKYRYGQKNLFGFADQVRNTIVNPKIEEYKYITIQLQGTDVEIRYTPKHFIALQAALEIYSDK